MASNLMAMASILKPMASYLRSDGLQPTSDGLQPNSAQDVVNFDFMEPPDRVRLVKSLRLLFLIGALDADGKLTSLGLSVFAHDVQGNCCVSKEQTGLPGTGDRSMMSEGPPGCSSLVFYWPLIGANHES